MTATGDTGRTFRRAVPLSHQQPRSRALLRGESWPFLLLTDADASLPPAGGGSAAGSPCGCGQGVSPSGLQLFRLQAGLAWVTPERPFSCLEVPRPRSDAPGCLQDAWPGRDSSPWRAFEAPRSHSTCLSPWSPSVSLGGDRRNRPWHWLGSSSTPGALLGSYNETNRAGSR